ncbi:hypothetical protein F4825DRAFT_457070 [Nemania diffusa]|nr:hypothetical protein F4825DRAFT_457070 [Nemania diffusa]
MQSLLVSIIAILAATTVAVPITAPRQLGGATAPLTTVLSQAGKHIPPAMERVGDSLNPKKNITTPGKTTAKKADPLGGLTGLLGGIVPAGLVPGL